MFIITVLGQLRRLKILTTFNLWRLFLLIHHQQVIRLIARQTRLVSRRISGSKLLDKLNSIFDSLIVNLSSVSHRGICGYALLLFLYHWTGRYVSFFTSSFLFLLRSHLGSIPSRFLFLSDFASGDGIFRILLRQYCAFCAAIKVRIGLDLHTMTGYKNAGCSKGQARFKHVIVFVQLYSIFLPRLYII